MNAVDDILKARLKTLGVSEYRFVVDSRALPNIPFQPTLTPLSTEPTKSISHINEMIIYDVGGSRTQRHEWMNYFEDGK